MSRAPTRLERLLDYLLAAVIGVLLAYNAAEWLACLGMVC